MEYDKIPREAFKKFIHDPAITADQFINALTIYSHQGGWLRSREIIPLIDSFYLDREKILKIIGVCCANIEDAIKNKNLGYYGRTAYISELTRINHHSMKKFDISVSESLSRKL